MQRHGHPSRRGILAGAAALAAAAALPRSAARSAAPPPGTRRIPSTGAEIPAIGLGTWITFNVGNDPTLRAECVAVMEAFFAGGGGVIDSSPMYGSSQPVVGHGLQALGHPQGLYAADKVWTSSGDEGPAQIARSLQYWSVPRFDLLQVHNLRAWEAHLPTLQEMKAAGRLRHVGITTSHARRHDEFEQVMRGHDLDCVQLTYNIVDREAEARLLPLARDRGMAVIVNRPFRQGALIRQLAGTPLPPGATEVGAGSWAQVLLKYILSHPAVTVAIPATRVVDHVRENKQAALGPMPDPAMRARWAAHVAEL